MSQTLTGGCLCGAVRYTSNPSETLHYLCHCSDCRKHGGTPFHCGIVVAADELEIAGAPKVWTKGADSGRTIARYFCGECGGHLMTSPWPEPTRYSIKAGTLDNPEIYKPVAEIWRQSLMPWADRSPELEPFDQGFLRPVSIGQGKIEM
ncbi:MAG: GFA family protein [Paracoccaceae bacterium]